jgi:TDG/mug DNA glycosylase family protein
MKKRGLLPIVGQNARILILGSLPGDESIRKQENYGNPRNRFWAVMGGVLDEEVPELYPERVNYLKKHGIALWDVLGSAEREGSLDSNIMNEEFNDIENFVSENPAIETIALNGKKAETSFRKYLRMRRSLAELRICFLPSTSAMSCCAGWDLERLVQSWRAIL